ncbi:MAG: hypothetical protein ACLS69_00835 [Butyricicoccus sp.]
MKNCRYLHHGRLPQNSFIVHTGREHDGASGGGHCKLNVSKDMSRRSTPAWSRFRPSARCRTAK